MPDMNDLQVSQAEFGKQSQASLDEARVLKEELRQREVQMRYRQFGKTQEQLEETAALLLGKAAGLDVTTPHGADTPGRFVRMLQELTTPEEFKFTTFPADTDNMVQLRDMPFSSLCNHHVIPFVGFAHVAYVPDKEMAGLSKFARLVRQCARKLTAQELLTKEIADRLEEILKPKGVAVVLEAEHFCMTIRGVQSPGTKTRTAEMRGVFGDHDRTAKAEFLSWLNGGH